MKINKNFSMGEYQ